MPGSCVRKASVAQWGAALGRAHSVLHTAGEETSRARRPGPTEENKRCRTQAADSGPHSTGAGRRAGQLQTEPPRPARGANLPALRRCYPRLSGVAPSCPGPARPRLFSGTCTASAATWANVNFCNPERSFQASAWHAPAQTPHIQIRVSFRPLPPDCYSRDGPLLSAAFPAVARPLTAAGWKSAAHVGRTRTHVAGLGGGGWAEASVRCKPEPRKPLPSPGDGPSHTQRIHATQ